MSRNVILFFQRPTLRASLKQRSNRDDVDDERFDECWVDKDVSMPSRVVEENDDDGESGGAGIKNDDEWKQRRSKEETQLHRVQT